MHAPKAPWPGTTTLSAVATWSASRVTKASAPARVNAFSTLRRLPLPVSTIAMRGFAIGEVMRGQVRPSMSLWWTARSLRADRWPAPHARREQRP